MKAGRPKKDPGKPSRRGRPRSQNADAFGQPEAEAEPGKKGKPKKAREPRAIRTALLDAILGEPSRAKPATGPDGKATPALAGQLDERARRIVRRAHTQGMVGGDLAALVVFELQLVQQLYREGTLEAKDYVVGVNKAVAHLAAAIQLASPGRGVPSRVRLDFDLGSPAIPVSTQPGRPERPPPGPHGDELEVG